MATASEHSKSPLCPVRLQGEHSALQPRDDRRCFSKGNELDLLYRDRPWLPVRPMRATCMKSRMYVNIEMSGSQAPPETWLEESFHTKTVEGLDGL